MNEEVLLLTRLIEDLQELAQAESGQLNLHLLPCDMSDVARKGGGSIAAQGGSRRNHDGLGSVL